MSATFEYVRCSALAAAAALTVCLAAADRAGGEELVLFSFDDVSIPWRDNLKLTLQRPQKHPNNPVMKPGAPADPDGIGTLLYGTVLKEGDKFRMWYIAWPQADKLVPHSSYYRPVAYAESPDGVHWEKPDLGLVEFRGNKHNNLVLIEPSGENYAKAYDYVSVLRDDDDPDPAKRYKMAYITFDQTGRNGTTATAVSPDGLRWRLANLRPFTKGHFENTSLIKFQGMFYAGGQNLGRYGGPLPDGSEGGRTMTVFFSPDFEHWSGGRSLAFFRSHAPASVHELTGQQLHMGAGLWNRGNVVVGLYGRWYGDTISTDPAKKKVTPVNGLKMDLGLVISNDAIHYREPVQNFVVVPHGDDDEWDSEAVLQAQAFHNTDAETYIWYSHWCTSTPFPLPELPAKVDIKPQAIGLLTMRRDGFGYLSKQITAPTKQPSGYRPDTGASLLTKSFTLPAGAKLYANVDGVSNAAPLEFALVDDTERPLPGTSPVRLEQSGVRVEVPLGGQAVPAATPFRVRVAWPDGPADPHLYALYLTTVGER